MAFTLSTIVTLLRFRVSLDYKVCKTLRIDLILNLVELPLSGAGAALHIHRLVEVISRSGPDDYLSTHDSPGIESASQAARVMGMIVSFFWGFCTVVGTLLLPLLVWKSYNRRTSVKRME